jgi:hypothetical protein
MFVLSYEPTILVPLVNLMQCIYLKEKKKFKMNISHEKSLDFKLCLSYSNLVF